MVFSSPAFLFYFLPTVLVLVFISRSVHWRNAVLIVFSLLFYAWGEPVFVLLLLASSFMAYLFGQLIDAQKDNRAIFAAGIAWQLATLVIAKYWDFLARTAQSIGIGLPEIGIPLPIGISFFTFQAISYLIDIRRGAAKPAARFGQVLLYISMFPQLIAGPIVRYQTVDGQLTRLATSPDRRMVGAQLFVIGLAQKTLIANEVGPLADIAFSQGMLLDWWEAWIGLAAYSLQIYFDFSGYSNMAIGLGLIFGFSFPRNFKDPYTSLSVTEFWRR